MMGVRFTFSQEKALAAIELLAEAGMNDLTKGKIAKLLFFADKRHLVQNGRPIIGDWYAALPHGPVPSQVDNLLDAFEAGNGNFPGVDVMNKIFLLDTKFQYPHLTKLPNVPNGTLREHLSESDIEVLQACIAQLGILTFSQLRSISHDQPAYTNAWESRGLSKDAAPMSFEDFFEDDPDSFAGVKESMIEDFMLHQRFAEPKFD